MKNDRLRIILVVTLVVVAAVTIAIVVWQCGIFSRPKVETVTVGVSGLPDEVLASLDEQFAEYMRVHPFVKITASKNDNSDLVLGPYRAGATVWRSLGWRLWTRLERLASFEGDFRRPLILPLREGRLDAEAFEAMMDDLRDVGTTPLAMPRSPSSYSEAMELYLERLGDQPANGKTAMDEWMSKGRLAQVPDLRAAVNALEKNEAVFILADDSLRDFLRVTPQSHFEGFPLPGSATPGAAWVLGKGEGFIIPDTAVNKTGALDLLTFLTSKGIAREFSQELPGYFYYWTEAPAPGTFPDVHGPAVFLSTDPH